jgi:ankyrin repeat protein
VPRLVANALHAASVGGNEAMVRRLLTFVPKSFNIDDQDEFGATPLINAANFGHAGVIKLLLEHGARVDVVAGKKNLTPLHCAVISGDVESVRLLIKAGSSLEARTKDGYTPLIVAAYTDRAPIVRALLAAGARIDSTESSGLTALHCAVREGSAEALKALIAAGADPRIRTSTGEDAFDIARKLDRSDLLSILETARR